MSGTFHFGNQSWPYVGGPGVVGRYRKAIFGEELLQNPMRGGTKKSRSFRENSPQLQQSLENKGLGELRLSKHIRSVHLLYRKGKTIIAGRLVY